MTRLDMFSDGGYQIFGNDQSQDPDIVEGYVTSDGSYKLVGGQLGSAT